MKLRVFLPTHIELDADVDKVNAETAGGAYCLLPRHVDFIAALVPGILSYERQGRERFLAVNGGSLVKCGDTVRVSTRDAVRGEDLAELRAAIGERFRHVNEQEAQARAAAQKMQADFVRRFIELEHGAL